MIYLSICIPTYNRSNYLKNTLDSIISQDEFVESDEVEIVISDNCSTDDTMDVVEPYLREFPAKIKYHRNNENILDRNYEQVLSLGSGRILKLNNDTLLFAPASLRQILPIIKQCVENEMIPFFVNGEIRNLQNPVICNDVTSFISSVSYWSTWIGGFFISKKKFEEIDDFSRKAHLMFAQVDVLMRLLDGNTSILVIPNKFLTSVTPTKKGGYNLPKVFLINYFQIISPFLKEEIRDRLIKKERKRMLYEFILPWMISLRIDVYTKANNFTFKTFEYKEIIKQHFSVFGYSYFEILLNLRIWNGVLRFFGKKWITWMRNNVFRLGT